MSILLVFWIFSVVFLSTIFSIEVLVEVLYLVIYKTTHVKNAGILDAALQLKTYEALNMTSKRVTGNWVGFEKSPFEKSTLYLYFNYNTF